MANTLLATVITLFLLTGGAIIAYRVRQPGHKPAYIWLIPHAAILIDYTTAYTQITNWTWWQISIPTLTSGLIYLYTGHQLVRWVFNGKPKRLPRKKIRY